MDLISTLWTEKYRPKRLNEYVFSDSHQQLILQNWASSKEVPHILFSGSPGTGKTSCAQLLVNELQIDPYDYLFINASRERNIDTMRDKIVNFVSTMPYGYMKIVLLDEADGISPLSQETLRGVMETYASTSRFFLTANYPTKIIPAIHSRVQDIKINKLDINNYTARMAEILMAENITFDLDVLDEYAAGCWPDLRKLINNCNQNSIDGALLRPDKTTSGSTRDYRIDAVSLIKSGNFRGARELICAQIRPEDTEDFFRWLYNNLDLFGTTDAHKDAAILIIRRGLVQIPMAADIEILVAAVLVELSQITQGA